MTDELILKNAKIVTPSEVVEGNVRICGGVVDAIHSGASSTPAALDMDGDYLIPGLVDIHTDNLGKL